VILVAFMAARASPRDMKYNKAAEAFSHPAYLPQPCPEFNLKIVSIAVLTKRKHNDMSKG